MTDEIKIFLWGAFALLWTISSVIRRLADDHDGARYSFTLATIACAVVAVLA